MSVGFQIPVPCAHGGHVEHVTNRRTTAPDTALSFELYAVEVIGSEADQRSDLFDSSWRGRCSWARGRFGEQANRHLGYQFRPMVLRS